MKLVLRTIILILLTDTKLASATDVYVLHQRDIVPASEQLSVPVYFRIGESSIDLSFMDNGVHLNRFLSSFARILSDSSCVVHQIVVTGTASPDGDEQVNIHLAGRRAQALAAYISDHIPAVSGKIRTVNGGENWSGLRAMIAASDMPYREEMLRIMDAYPHDRDQRKHLMQYYAQSKAWYWLYEHCFPALRTGAGGAAAPSGREANPEETSLSGSGVTVSYVTHSLGAPDILRLSPAAERNTPAAQPQRMKVPVAASSRRFSRPGIRPLLALKTDLVQWAGIQPSFTTGTFVPNLAVECYLGGRWSLLAAASYSDWKGLYDEKIHAAAGYEFSPRFWFRGGSCFRGFFAGLYGFYGTYDVRTAGCGDTGSWYGGGIAAGFLQPLSRHWALEAELRGAYRLCRNDNYRIEEGRSFWQCGDKNDGFIPALRLNLLLRWGPATD